MLNKCVYSLEKQRHAVVAHDIKKFVSVSDCNEFIRRVTTVSLYQAWLPISNNVTYAERCEISLRELILNSLTLVREGSEPGAWNAMPHLQQITDLMAYTL